MKIALKKKEHWEANGWFSFFPKRAWFKLSISESFYFDPRPMFITNVTSLVAILGTIGLIWAGLTWYSLLLLPLFMFGWGEIFISLPLDSGIEDSEWKDVGISWYGEGGIFPDSLMVGTWGRTRFFNLPWSLQWYQTAYFGKDKTWIVCEKGQYFEPWTAENKAKLWRETHPYKYALKSGEVQNVFAEITMVERTWRRKALMWTSLFGLKKKVIEVEFSREVGEGANTWKGGTTGCNYEMKRGEAPVAALSRMERERKFTR